MPIIEEDRPSKEDYDIIRAQSESITKVRSFNQGPRKKKAYFTNLSRANSVFPKEKEYKISHGKLNDKLAEQLELQQTSKIKPQSHMVPGLSSNLDNLSSLEKNLNLGKNVNKRRVLYLKEIEVFTITSDITKPIALVQPFTVNVGKELHYSYDHHFDISSNLEEPRNITKSTKIFDRKRDSGTASRLLGQISNKENAGPQNYHVYHQVRLFYIPFSEIPKYRDLTAAERLQAYLIDDSILSQEKTFQVIKKINHMMLSKHKRSSQVKTRGRNKKCFGIFEQRYFEVKLALDCIHLTNYNSHINFVLHLNKEVIRSWSFLDVSLKMRLEIAKDN